MSPSPPHSQPHSQPEFQPFLPASGKFQPLPTSIPASRFQSHSQPLPLSFVPRVSLPPSLVSRLCLPTSFPDSPYQTLPPRLIPPSLPASFMSHAQPGSPSHFVTCSTQNENLGMKLHVIKVVGC